MFKLLSELEGMFGEMFAILEASAIVRASLLQGFEPAMAQFVSSESTQNSSGFSVPFWE